jgi:hypothetical protein
MQAIPLCDARGMVPRLDAGDRGANSLFRNILPVTSAESRFCASTPFPSRRNFKKTGILSDLAQKKLHDRSCFKYKQ